MANPKNTAMAIMQAGSYHGGAAVTPNDSTDLPRTADALYIGGAGAGALSVIFDGDDASTDFAGLTANTILPFRVSRVLSTGTSVTAIVALFST